jgi:hypothetical protein
VPVKMDAFVPGGGNANAMTLGNMNTGSARNRAGLGLLKPGFSVSAGRPHAFGLALPSGKVLTSSNVDIHDTVSRQIDSLWDKCLANQSDAVYFLQRGSTSQIEAMATVRRSKLSGPALLFHSGKGYERQRPKYYATYQDGKRHGVVATWSESGQQEFWGNYVSGQRHGLCCLLKSDALTAVVECNRGKIEAMHLVAGNQVSKSWSDADEALADTAAGPIVKEIEDTEKDLKKDDLELRDRLRKGIQERVGARNSEKLKSFNTRSSGRAAAKEQAIRGLQKAAGY